MRASRLHSPSAPLRALAPLLAVLALGCLEDPDAVVVVDLRTDYTPGLEFDAVRTEMVVRGEPWAGARTLGEAAVDRDTAMLPAFRAAQALDGLAPGTDYRVRVTLLNGAERVADQVRRLNVTDASAGLTFVVTRACADVECAEGQVCQADGACVDEEQLCFGEDRDGEACPGSECRDDADCTGGLSCEVGSCLAGQCLYVTDRDVCGDRALCTGEPGRVCGEEQLEEPGPRSPTQGEFVGSHLITTVRRLGGTPKLLFSTPVEGAVYEAEVYRCPTGVDDACIEGEPFRSLDPVAQPPVYVEPPLPRDRYAWRVRSSLDGRFSPWSITSHFWVGDRNDTDGDGTAEIFVSAPDETPDGRGQVYGHSGLDGTWTALREEGAMGGSLAVGDVNGDGLADVIAGARYYNGGETHQGQVAVALEGGRGGRQYIVAPPTPRLDGEFGRAVAYLNDYDKDGIGDFAVSEPGAASVHVYLGRRETMAPEPWATVSGPANAAFGRAVEGCDVNADSFPDLVVGAPEAASGGALYVYDNPFDYGSVQVVTPPAGVTGFGAAVRCVPDITGNGLNDLLIGAPSTAPNGALFILESGFGYRLGRVPLDGPPSFPAEAASFRYGHTVDSMRYEGSGLGDAIVATSESPGAPTLIIEWAGGVDHYWRIDCADADCSGESSLQGQPMSYLPGPVGRSLARVGPYERAGHFWTLAVADPEAGTLSALTARGPGGTPSDVIADPGEPNYGSVCR